MSINFRKYWDVVILIKKILVNSFKVVKQFGDVEGAMAEQFEGKKIGELDMAGVRGVEHGDVIYDLVDLNSQRLQGIRHRGRPIMVEKDYRSRSYRVWCSECGKQVGVVGYGEIERGGMSSDFRPACRDLLDRHVCGESMPVKDSEDERKEVVKPKKEIRLIRFKRR